MRRAGRLGVLLIGSIAVAQRAPVISPVGTIKELMLDVIHPSSNDILLVVNRGGPRNEEDWRTVRRGALTLAESASLLLSRGPGSDDWVKNVKSLADAGAAAYRSAQAKDAIRLAESTESIDASCTRCHRKYRPNVFPPEEAK